MSDHIQAPGPMQIQSKKKLLRKPIQVINYKTDILNKLKNYQYGKVSIANLTLNNQNEFMKCWASGTEATSLSGWSAETTNRHVAAFSSMYCLNATQWQIFYLEFRKQICKHAQSHFSNFNTSCRSNIYFLNIKERKDFLWLRSHCCT